ncbi:hypothetical protein PRZ48_012559 [Zasmidium cellare]|uniref:Enoyl reductase (ER) domain-containing protein n=1 Tax=Zasmidium cellare TaxID=395010 RepID=A0ABR0E575_ZASCE|nr:hypothetical protein PRZ48_012559 [Zasmidium cellare]
MMSAQNQAWQITTPNTLTLASLGPLPQPGPNQVLLRIHAVALNYRDTLIISHNPPTALPAKPNLIPCCDAAGTITQTGPSSRWSVGQNVIVSPHTWVRGSDDNDFSYEELLGGGAKDGTLRRWMVVGDEGVVRCPKGLDLVEASTLWTAGVTAWRALRYSGVELGAGRSVLTMGTGGLAAAAGATVISTSSSDEKLQTAKSLAATHLINYTKHPDWSTRVLSATSGKGVDLVLDVVGAESVTQTIKSTAHGGTISLVGILSRDTQMPVNIMTDILFKSLILRGQIGTGSRQMAQELCAFVEEHDLNPPIAKVFEFEEAREAVEALTRLGRPGKIVVRC